MVGDYTTPNVGSVSVQAVRECAELAVALQAAKDGLTGRKNLDRPAAYVHLPLETVDEVSRVCRTDLEYALEGGFVTTRTEAFGVCFFSERAREVS